MPTRYLPLLWANLNRKRLRTGLTLASIVIAFLLFGLLQALRMALTGTPELAGADRLITIHKVSIIQSLPQSYLNRIRSVDGVKVATAMNWFGGIYQDERNQIGSFPVEVATFLEVYPDYEIAPEQRAAWQADRTAAIVGTALMDRFGWKVGDVIPLRSNIWQKQDGSNVWDLKIAGVYSARNGDNAGVYFHYEYFNESRAFGRDAIGWVTLRVTDPDRAVDVAGRIDALFANSPTETKTATEKAFIQGFANQMGNIGALLTAIAAAVFFTMLLVTANTMGQSIRERISEIGVMKTLGFSALSVSVLVFAEALVITLLGAAIGLALASVAAGGLAKALQEFFPMVGIPGDTYVVGAALALGLATIAAALPCAQAWRLRIVDALRK